ncbi:Helix-turn-helix domain-containing protein [Prauserella aidingensis]|uniref:helix-turn-helix domain-containing protein n=1 Tax=Prauserella aidingensis TaxID=387890 RepID=UPI0020A5911D|nr:helix-turn-helix transcriptional regulator [Prauserella aidingensis]MCP2252372.1 Helix-turn-helix domain-containing protein [Prauserella aidingensis]
MTDLDQRRIALADELAVLMRRAGLSGRQLAAAVGWQASKVSRILSGKQRVTDDDLATWLTAADAPTAEAERLRDELRAIRAEEARWSRRAASGHRALQEDMAAREQHATRIRTVDLALVPGLVQTADYARAVFTSLADLRDTPRDTDQAVQARMQRQHVLYDSSRTIELLTTESALRTPVGDASVMAAQLDRLRALDGLANVHLRIIPLGATLPVPLLHGFWILDDYVLVETLHSDASTSVPDDVDLYRRIADMLWAAAAEGDAARAILTRVASHPSSG